MPSSTALSPNSVAGQADATWDELLLAFAQSGRRVMRAHPGIATAIIGESPRELVNLGWCLASGSTPPWPADGFADADMVVGFFTVMVFVLGFVAMETPRHAATVAAAERDRWWNAWRRSLHPSPLPISHKACTPCSTPGPYLDQRSVRHGIANDPGWTTQATRTRSDSLRNRSIVLAQVIRSRDASVVVARCCPSRAQHNASSVAIPFLT